MTGFGDGSQVSADVASPSSPRDGTQGWEQAMEVVASIAVDKQYHGILFVLSAADVAGGMLIRVVGIE